MMDTKILRELGLIVGERDLLTSPEDLVCYSYDASQPTLDQLPSAVLNADSTEEVAAIVRLANRRRFAVVPRGSGTNLSGGAIPLRGAVVLNLGRMKRILELDADNLTATVEAGVITDQLLAAVEAEGLLYPPDPASSSVSSIGGNVAENAGGLRGLKYGVTGDYVLGLEVVLPTGEVIVTGGKCFKDVAGYDLTSLFVGSEGTLGVVTKITVRLIPPPQAKRTLLALYRQVEEASRSVSGIIAAHLIPATLEILDGTTIRYVEEFKGLGLPVDLGAILLIEVDGRPTEVEEESSRVAEICRSLGATEVSIASSEEEALQLREARKAALPALARVRPTTILEDVTVPRSQLAPMVKKVREIAQHHDVSIAVFGHAGDGNLHPTCMTDERDREEMERVQAALTEIFATALELGGTITGEHGIGLKKRPFLPQAVGQARLEAMVRIKNVLDPQGILNPGKIFREAGPT
jgi:glycolate oxidase